MTTIHRIRMSWAVGAVALALIVPATVMAGRHLFEPKCTIKEWRQKIPDGVVKEVRAEVQRTKGNEKTYINARFGGEFDTFENGRRIYLPDDKMIKITWKIGRAPGDRPLVITAHDGEALLKGVAVEY